jgi:uncharacterized membrane protein
MMGGGGAMFGFGMLFWIVILGVIVWAVVQATTRSSQSTPTRPSSAQSTKEILDARLARGEISVEEYKKLRETLESH